MQVTVRRINKKHSDIHDFIYYQIDTLCMPWFEYLHLHPIPASQSEEGTDFEREFPNPKVQLRMKQRPPKSNSLLRLTQVDQIPGWGFFWIYFNPKSWKVATALKEKEFSIRMLFRKTHFVLYIYIFRLCSNFIISVNMRFHFCWRNSIKQVPNENNRFIRKSIILSPKVIMSLYFEILVAT